jgi:hypothetical protein
MALIPGARFSNRRHVGDSHEIDKGFDRAVAVFSQRERLKNERDKPTGTQKPPKGKQYFLEGTLNSDGMPIPLRESFRAENPEEAKAILEEKTKHYHELEGCGISMHLYDTPNYPKTALASKYYRPKKD